MSAPPNTSDAQPVQSEQSAQPLPPGDSSPEQPPMGAYPTAAGGFVRINVRPLPSIPGSSGSHTPAAEASSTDQVDLQASEPISDPVAEPPSEAISTSRPLDPRQSNTSIRVIQPAPMDEPFDEFDAVGDRDRVIPTRFNRGAYGTEPGPRPALEDASAKDRAPQLPARDYPPAGRIINLFPPPPHTDNARPSSSADPYNSLPATTPSALNNVNQTRPIRPDAPRERPNFNQRPSGSSMTTRTQSQRYYSASEQAVRDTREAQEPTPPPKDPPYIYAQRRQSRVMSLMSAMDERVGDHPPQGGVTSERSTALERRISLRPGGGVGGSRWSLQQEELPRRGKEIRKGYYRLYTPSGILFSSNPIYANDISLSTFDIEHVPPPRLAENYIAYVAQRENLRPSGVQMYITRLAGNPEPVANLQTAINMDHLDKDCGRTRQRPLLFVVQGNSDLPGRRYPSQDALDALPLRDLGSELSIAHYRIFGLAQASRGGQQPMPSHSPLYRDDPSLGKFFIDYVPPPLRAKDYMAYIGELTDVHPSRIRLYLRWKSADSETTAVAEAREVDLEDIVGTKTALSTSEQEPLLVNVELGLDDYGDLDFATKNLPLPRVSFKGIAGKLNRRLSKLRKRSGIVY
ncbi:hypothetical protein M407DRAFT_33369 [Tulasnella calospora MUT 4182]|uniref:Uncharacterized protein n=1 Tax=Tulasnella calospora MUT 4182 TaxID=1051891 RepID=A0A0C3K6I7_9AGAM|nr:hypothetical protein M407DRAFT_33369 [Tulasnella calospora MUT 4182]